MKTLFYSVITLFDQLQDLSNMLMVFEELTVVNIVQLWSSCRPIVLNYVSNTANIEHVTKGAALVEKISLGIDNITLPTLVQAQLDYIQDMKSLFHTMLSLLSNVHDKQVFDYGINAITKLCTVYFDEQSSSSDLKQVIFTIIQVCEREQQLEYLTFVFRVVELTSVQFLCFTTFRVKYRQSI